MKKWFAVLTASAMLTNAVQFSAFAAGTESAVIPLEVPDTYPETADFLNTYGNIYVQDNYICFCGNFTEFPGYVYRFQSESSTAVFEILSEESYKVEDMADGWNHTVMVFQANSAGTLEFTWTEDISVITGNADDIRTVYHFTFSVDEQLQITETDIFAFTPDGFYEAEAFEQENGSVSIQDGYIVYCKECCLDGGYEVFLNDDENTLAYDIVFEDYISLQYREGWAPPGGTNYFVQVLKPKETHGYLKLNWEQRREWEEETYDTIYKIFEVASTTSDITDITDLTDFCTSVRAVDFYTGENMPDVTLGIFLHSECDVYLPPILTWNTSDDPYHYIDYVDMNLFPWDAYIGIVSMPDDYQIMVNEFTWTLCGQAELLIVLATDEEIEADFTLGDVNDDNQFTLTDAVALQKWLLGSGTLVKKRAADFNEDHIINIYDLCMLKTALLEKFEALEINPSE